MINGLKDGRLIRFLNSELGSGRELEHFLDLEGDVD
jgi:hypothetical protein